MNVISGLFAGQQPLTRDTMLFPCGMSRSGTTLLATVMDSHSQISMAYELIPPQMGGPTWLRKALAEGMAMTGNDFGQSGSALRKAGQGDAGLVITRCHRAGLTASELDEVLAEMEQGGMSEITSLRDRLAFAWRVARKKSLREGTAVYGFKLNIPSYLESKKLFPGGYFVYIVRDPRDVVASHIQRGFKRTVDEICNAWNKYTEAFERLRNQWPHSSVIVRYEDLVTHPRTTIVQMFAGSPVAPEEQVFTFYNSKATIHQSAHPNSENLKKDFFTTNVSRWKNDLPQETVALIESRCHRLMGAYHYV